jgi:hypothetical protein
MFGKDKNSKQNDESLFIGSGLSGKKTTNAEAHYERICPRPEKINEK